MKLPIRAIVVLVLLTVAAGVLGGWLGITYGERHAGAEDNLHALVHEDLHLTAAQNRQIETLETAFAARRKTLEAQMRKANRDLAAALTADHRYGPGAQAAIDAYHQAATQLQEATIRHVMAMRAVLNPDQSKTFDHAINEALTAGAP